MKSMKNKEKMRECNVSSGIERKRVLERGDVWIKPTMCMEARSKYNRKRSKHQVRKMMEAM